MTSATTAPTTTRQEPAADPAAPARSTRTKALLLAGPLLLLAVGWYLLLGPGSAGDAGADDEPVAGEVLPLDPITMNLADGRLLKVGLALQLVEGAGDGHGPISGSVALDEAIAFLGERTYAELSAPDGRQHAKAELSERVAQRYHHEVLEVYFTEFVMQ